MSEFNKEEYRKRRSNKLRGQGPKVIPLMMATPEQLEKSHKSGSHPVQSGSKIIIVNRTTARHIERQNNHNEKMTDYSKVACANTFAKVIKKEIGEKERVLKKKLELVNGSN